MEQWCGNKEDNKKTALTVAEVIKTRGITKY